MAVAVVVMARIQAKNNYGSGGGGYGNRDTGQETTMAVAVVVMTKRTDTNQD